MQYGSPSPLPARMLCFEKTELGGVGDRADGSGQKPHGKGTDGRGQAVASAKQGCKPIGRRAEGHQRLSVTSAAVCSKTCIVAGEKVVYSGMGCICVLSPERAVAGVFVSKRIGWHGCRALWERERLEVRARHFFWRNRRNWEPA